jgi:hypothetical protein
MQEMRVEPQKCGPHLILSDLGGINMDQIIEIVLKIDSFIIYLQEPLL